MSEIYDVVIVGAGPAGMSASLYSSRANLKTLLIDKGLPGGQMLNTETIENYVGSKSIKSSELSNSMYEDAIRFGAELITDEITNIEKNNDVFDITTALDTYKSKSVIVATGTKYKKLNVPGEVNYDGKGVSYCATCDGIFYQGKKIAVVGGGDSALESALYLTQFGEVNLIHRKKEYRAKPYLQDMIKENDKIKEIMDTEVDHILSSTDDYVTSIKLYDRETQETKEIDIDGVFVSIGQEPNTTFLPKDTLTKNKWVDVNKSYETKIPGLFAIGDVIDKDVRQVANAVGEGSEVVHYLFNYLQTL